MQCIGEFLSSASVLLSNRGASDYEQRFSNPKAQHIFTTIRDFLNAIDDPKVLQVVLDLPLNQSLPCGLTLVALLHSVTLVLLLFLS